jgi:hypothetical protein
LRPCRTGWLTGNGRGKEIPHPKATKARFPLLTPSSGARRSTPGSCPLQRPRNNSSRRYPATCPTAQKMRTHGMGEYYPPEEGSCFENNSCGRTGGG